MSDSFTQEEQRDRRRRIARTTLDERLAWLDEALALAHKTGALERARRKKQEQG